MCIRDSCLLCKAGLVICCKGIKTKITAKFRASRCLCFEDTKRIMSPEIRPKSFGTFEKQAPDLKVTETLLGAWRSSYNYHGFKSFLTWSAVAFSRHLWLLVFINFHSLFSKIRIFPVWHMVHEIQSGLRSEGKLYYRTLPVIDTHACNAWNFIKLGI